MIELLVSMVLMAIVVAGLVYVVIQLSSGNDDLQSERSAQQDGIEAMEQLRHDLTGARSPALEQFSERKEVLRGLVYYLVDPGSSGVEDLSRRLCQNVTGPQYVNCMQTVIWADPNQVWFRADVDSTNDGSECVGYVFERRGGSPDFTLTRYVSADWFTCNTGLKGAGGTTQTQLLQSATAPTQPIFSYVLQYNSKMNTGEVPRLSDCITESKQDATLLQRQRGFITSVRVNLGGLVSARGSSSTAELSTSIPISAHTAGDYSYALGCAP